MKKLLRTMVLTTIASESVVACCNGGKSTPVQNIDFKNVNGWQEINGAVTSLLTVGSNLYVGTITSTSSGKLLYKALPN